MKHFQPSTHEGHPRQGAGCMILSRRTGRFLFCLRPEAVPSGGTWAIWGGKGEAGESPAETALREVGEETGYHYGGPLLHLHHSRHGNFRYDTFLIDVADEFAPAPSLEWERFEWAAPGEFPEPMHWGLKSLLSDGTALRLLSNEYWRRTGRGCDFPALAED